MIVFSAVEEFLKELETDKDLIERKIVRLTNLYQQSPMTPVIRHLFVAATYKAAGEIVQFTQYIGDLWNAEQDEKPVEKSIALQQQIEEECTQWGLEVRAGMYREAGDGKDHHV
jgi:hypothetical protein